MMLLVFSPGIVVKAAGAEDTSAIGFYVRALLPENQIDKNLTYFDLRVQPGHTQQLEVEVVNETDEAITIDVTAISASTNRNGVIDYKTPDIRDKTLLHPFSELAVFETDSLTIPARGVEIARISLTMPQDEYDGVVLGGLVFTRRLEGIEPGEGEMALQNVYSYVIGAKLTENDTIVTPDFELEGIEAATVNYQPSMTHYLRNRTAAIAKGIDLHVVVSNAGGELVAQASYTGVDMAPNSVMPLAIAPGAGISEGGATSGSSIPVGELQLGEYTSTVTLEHEGQNWTFEEKFTIGRVEAEQINDEAIGSEPVGMSTSTILLILLIVAAVVIIALFILLLLVLRRKREKKSKS